MRNFGTFPCSHPLPENNRTVWLDWEDSNLQMSILQRYVTYARPHGAAPLDAISGACGEWHPCL